ncbi:MAG: NosD domain-containing protein [Candidatus Bathyarchaeia archaeon]
MEILRTAELFLLILATFLTCTVCSAFAGSIQEWISTAVPGEKLVVKRGEYIERIVINKSIYLKGEDVNAVILNSNRSGDVITVLGENVVLESLFVKNCGEGFAGIYVKARNVTIIDCLIMNCYIGIKIDSSSRIRIINCTIMNNTYAGIRVWGASEDVEIQNCTIFGNKYAAVGLFTFSKRNMLSNNVIYGNYIGVALINSRENQIVKNKLFNNHYGVYFEDRLSTDNMISKNTLVNNTFGVYINIFSESLTNNIFCRNNFVNNTVQVRFEPPYYSINYWNLSYPLGGNYWSDCTFEDLDSDGFVDKPYYIAKNNVDYRPLSSPYHEPAAEKTEDKWLFSQIIIAIVVIVCVYGLSYLLFRRRWPKRKIG